MFIYYLILKCISQFNIGDNKHSILSADYID